MRKVFSVFLVAILFLVVSFTPKPTKKIVIDLGHGGHDKGVVVNGISEKEVVLSLATKLRELAEESGIALRFTRSSDSFVTLEERIDFINKENPDVMLSLHVNSSDNEVEKGFEMYLPKDANRYTASHSKAEQLGKALAKHGDVKPIKTANFYLLKNTSCPALFLEMGFLTNEADRNFLTSDYGRTVLAQSILEALND
ncbi:N-acetylmuramoyl-L-alanine amidase family protein [Luteirhabdus pelagi]|uniref:N-acetylmuramoyl-L-alanine amidase family protein n=1 Tax=Luteirhabdus pelagi TaxID=2792783 RepID=UPI00193A32F5|nr:N-acetylmuramoyl-L-alanine amidase [Luteirhabdus pelagi]